MATLDFERMLAPVPGEFPAGRSLKHEPVYDEIKAARKRIELKNDENDEIQARRRSEGKEDDEPVSSDSVRPELDLIFKRAAQAIATQSKDIQLAVWCLEAAAQLDDFDGIAQGLRLIRELLERYWETAFPAIDKDDPSPLESRASVMGFIETRLPMLVKRVPLTDGDKGTYGLEHFDALQNLQLIQQNKWPDKPKLDIAMAAASLAFLEGTAQALALSQSELEQLQALADVKFVARRPSSDNPDRLEPFLSFRRLGEVLSDAKIIVDRTLAAKGPRNAPRTETPPPAASRVPEPETSAPVETPTASPTAPVTAPPANGTVRTRDAALARVAESVAFLVADNPLEPTAYLLSRAVAFGLLYAYDHLGGTQLDAPSPEVRERLRTLFAKEDWLSLIQEAEVELSRKPKQAWLDLHRFVITALERLGGEFALAASAVRGQVAALAARHPTIGDAEFSDGTPVANRETKQWLQQLQSGAALTASMPTVATAPAAVTMTTPSSEAFVAQAVSLMRGGRASDGLTILQSQVAAARSGRDRFLRQVELAEACFDTKNLVLAFPILEALVATIERARVDEWEDGDVIARVYVLFIRCGREMNGTPEAQARTQEIFGRLCRLDASKALLFEQGASPMSRSPKR